MTSSPGYEGERARKRGVKVFSLLSSEFQDNDWAVTVQRRSQPSETMTSASFSLFISLHFSPFSFFSYYTHTQKKKKIIYRQNLHLICMAVHRSPSSFTFLHIQQIHGPRPGFVAGPSPVGVGNIF